MKKLTVGAWIENPLAGQRTRLIHLPAETGGATCEIEYINEPYCGKFGQLPHLHTTYTEHFTILAGRARYRLGDAEYTAEPGTTVTFPPGLPHLHPWSDSAEALYVRHSVAANPPDLKGLNAYLNTAITFYGLARDGKVGRGGRPGLLQLAVSSHSTLPATCSVDWPVSVQRVLFGLLALIGQLAGVRATYPAYGEICASIPDCRTVASPREEALTFFG